ncbi:MAG: NADH-quinone oxidoreductase subunit C [Acidobacteriota bacterium]
MADQETQVPVAPKPPWEEKPIPPAPQDAREHGLAREVAEAVPDAVLEAVEFVGQVTLTVAVDKLADVARACKERLGYAFLVDLTVVDWRERPEGRFDVVYWLHRHHDSVRLRLKVRIADGTELRSMTAVWKVANWMEREAFDMFGVYFAGHPNLERILTWEGFNGHPLRKDFPIEGVDTGAAIYPDVFPPGGGPAKSGEGEA